MPIPLAFHKIDDLFEWGLTRNSVNSFKRIVDYLESIQFKCKDDRFEITFDDGYESVYLNALPILKSTSLRPVIFIIAGFIGKNSSWDIYPGAGRFTHLSKKQIRTLAANKVKIGSHTMTHCDLCRLNKRQLEYELLESKKLLEDICGQAVDLISYPFGRYNRRVIDAALAGGYKYGYTFFRNRQMLPGDENTINMMRERIPIYLFDTPLTVMLKLSSFGRFENLKGRIIKSYNVFSDIFSKTPEELDRK